MTNIILTASGARLTQIRSDTLQKPNWLFLPGGPGLGAESLQSLTDILELPGTLWLLDLPGDGANSAGDFANWSTALIEACSHMKHTILVAHSTGGMFALATPPLEKSLMGMIIMNSAPNHEWKKRFADFMQAHITPEITQLTEEYQEDPSDDLLKELTLECAPLYSSDKRLLQMLGTLPFNHRSHLWAEQHFEPSYVAKWIPQKMPVLIFSGDRDFITPLELFSGRSDFLRRNIFMCKIKNAGHFPWFENPEQVQVVFQEFAKMFRRPPPA